MPPKIPFWLRAWFCQIDTFLCETSALLLLSIDGCVLGGMPRSSLPVPCAQEANKGDSKQTCINKKTNKKDQSSKNLSKITRLGGKHLKLKNLI